MGRQRLAFLLAGGFVGGLLFGVAPVGAVHDPDLTDGEVKCQLATAKAIEKFVGSKAKCLIKCQGALRKGDTTRDCTPPGFDAVTQTCVTTAEDKAKAGELKKCSGDNCPECYAGGVNNCQDDADARVADTENQVDAFVPLVWCDDSASGDGLNSAEAKCQDAVAKNGAGLVKKMGKCYQKCRAAEHKGTVAAGACNPPTSDATTQTCISAAKAKAAAGIDKKCADDPDCYSVALQSGSGWANLIGIAIDGAQADTYCGSPSGAFLD
jgi:hypothetical protein